eukprot:1821848-Rhodomonas_salina.3
MPCCDQLFSEYYTCIWPTLPTAGIVLRAAYDMSGTEVAYAILTGEHISLRARYAMSGTAYEIPGTNGGCAATDSFP